MTIDPAQRTRHCAATRLAIEGRRAIGVETKEKFVRARAVLSALPWERLDAIIGDTVNCASRLESFEKSRHVGVLRVLVSSTTRELLGDQLNNSLHWDEWGEIQVKGREEPLLVAELKMGSEQEAQQARPNQ